MIKTIKQIVSEHQHDCMVESTRALREVLMYMRDRNLSAVAVMQDDRVAGVFAGRDAIHGLVLDGANLDDAIVGDLMSTPVHWIAADERYEVAKAIMADNGVRQLVVLDENQAFCGFITALELFKADLADARDLISKLNDSYYAPKYDAKPSR
jgi:CBS domain-containing protein